MTTKKQRIATHIQSGLTPAEAALAVAQEDADEERAQVEKTAIEIVKENFPDVWDDALSEARERILKPRRGRKKKVTSVPASVPETPAEAPAAPVYDYQQQL